MNEKVNADGRAVAGAIASDLPSASWIRVSRRGR